MPNVTKTGKLTYEKMLDIMNKMQIKATKKYHYEPTRTAKIRKTGHTVLVTRREQLELSCGAGGNGTWYDHFGKQLAVPLKIKRTLTT